ncbi:MAG: tRNA (adenosine(37)-N6)-dimethylallyltransferase MiaA [Candidatus Hinthialibacter antarcticus]|nr:tRNA (adenosine(37)-N6)-dimethylallyltransferase MiaA [Candidatus Hinthialibacter antarcticus]
MQNTSHPISNQHTASQRPLFLAVVGPTASGKTDLALDLAERLDADILCVDAIQIYRGLDVGSAKPTLEQQARIKHYGIDLISPMENFNASRYAEAVEPVLQQAEADQRPLVLCGGTGLYYRSLLEGFFDAPDSDPAVRGAILQRVEREGANALHAELLAADPETAAVIHPNDGRRVARALELIQLTGEPVSALKARQRRKPWIDRTMFFGIQRERDELSARVVQRTRWMYDNGLIDETRQLLAMGCDEQYTAMQALGYKECMLYVQDKIDLNESIEMTIQGTRRYSKRQMTWFRRQMEVNWLEWREGEPLQEKRNQCLKLWNNRG